MKSNYFLIVCSLYMFSLFCMEDHYGKSVCSGKDKHNHECALNAKASDWNCFGRVSDNLSLLSNKIWLMTLFISTPDSSGMPTRKPGSLREISDIEHFRKEAKRNIKNMLRLASCQPAQDYIAKYHRFFDAFNDLEVQWVVEQMQIKKWLQQILVTCDTHGCMQLEKKFIEIHKPNIGDFYYYFLHSNEIARRHYLNVFIIAGHKKVLLRSHHKGKYEVLFREYVVASVQPDLYYFDRLRVIVDTLVDFSNLKFLRSIMRDHFDPNLNYSIMDEIVGYIDIMNLSEQLISCRLKMFLAAMHCGFLRHMVNNDFLIKTLSGPIQTYEDSLFALRKLICPPTSSFRMPIPAPPIITKARKNVPILKLSPVTFPRYEQIANLPPLSS